MQTQRKIITIILLIGALFIISGCNTTAQEELPTPTPIPTPIVPTKPTYEVMVGEISNELQFTGRIAPVVEEELFFRADGRVRNVYVEKGDPVEEGTILADLEYLDNLERQYAADQLSLRRAEIYAENAQHYLDLFQLSTNSPDLQVAYAKQALAEAEKAVADATRAYALTQSSASQAGIDAAYAQTILADQALERAQEAFEPHAHKPEDNLARARAQSALSAAQSNYDAAVRTYNGMSNTSSPAEQTLAASQLETTLAQLTDAQAKLELIVAGLGYDQELALKENDVELAQIALNEAQLGIADLEKSIADARLTAPLDGEVFSLGLADGRTVEAYRIYAVVADMSSLEISADLTSEDTLDLEEGMVVSVVLANRPSEEYTGSIRRLPYLGSTSTNAEDEDKSTRVAMDVDPLEVGLEVGDLMRTTVILEHKEDVLWLPPQAIRTFEGRNFVVVQDGEFQARVDVKIGIEAEDRVEILEGLEAGQIVIGP
jgi:multidrug efflux pump subunit AcrA (membrane-fusion protein)